MAAAPLRHTWSDADAYETFMGRWSEFLVPKFIAFTGVSAGGRALDVGSGTGVLSKALADRGWHVIGIDATESYLEAARRHRSHPNITFESGDMRRMRFADHSFDAAVSTLAIDVVPEIEQVVGEMKRVTRSGGIVASAVHQFLGGLAAFDLVLNTAAALDAGCREARSARAGRQQFWPNAQADLWRRMGLVDVVETPIVIDCEYPTFADYWSTFTGGQGIVSSYVTALPDGLREEIREHVRAGYLLGLPDGPRSFPMMFRAVRGVCP